MWSGRRLRAVPVTRATVRQYASRHARDQAKRHKQSYQLSHDCPPFALCPQTDVKLLYRRELVLSIKFSTLPLRTRGFGAWSASQWGRVNGAPRVRGCALRHIAAVKLTVKGQSAGRIRRQSNTLTLAREFSRHPPRSYIQRQRSRAEASFLNCGPSPPIRGVIHRDVWVVPTRGVPGMALGLHDVSGGVPAQVRFTDNKGAARWRNSSCSPVACATARITVPSK